MSYLFCGLCLAGSPYHLFVVYIVLKSIQSESRRKNTNKNNIRQSYKYMIFCFFCYIVGEGRDCFA